MGTLCNEFASNTFDLARLFTVLRIVYFNHVYTSGILNSILFYFSEPLWIPASLVNGLP